MSDVGRGGYSYSDETIMVVQTLDEGISERLFRARVETDFECASRSSDYLSSKLALFPVYYGRSCSYLHTTPKRQ